jgi:glutamate synthase domain-containing protein 3
MGGGRIVVRPPDDDAGDPVLVGNTVLYGATGGELFCAGRAGERFAVRNSGAVAVVEGTGDHPCEYMTNGTVVILGDPGRNLGAGMSGGQVYVYDPAHLLATRLNDDLVVPLAVQEPAEELRQLLERHVRYTGSARATELLEKWSEALRSFVRVTPKTDVARLEDEHEGTLGLEADTKRVGKGKAAAPDRAADDGALAPEVAQAAHVGK